ncbi:cytochrome P450 [uncultured Microbacterium sp.]|uniref:cytochrome P450 n=1 Tax=uncultured Microbacterium sp. TaxID=191216 RepID=UPI0028E59265|nr:cytochrome P450 [uncultured Microbacterium sp.]
MSTNERISVDGHGRVVIGDHAEVTRIARDAAGFSSAVSRHLQVPNGLDGAAHAEMRRLIDPFMDAGAVDALTADLEAIAADLLSELVERSEPFGAVGDLGARFAVRAQSAWLGWLPEWEEPLLEWVADNRVASRTGHSEATAVIAERFDAIIRELLRRRRETPRGDVTSALMALRHDDGSALGDDELVSILRNVTGGDLGSLALCAGVIVHWLARHPEHQHHLAEASDADLDAAIDEILRADDPFVSNRRRARVDTDIAGCPVRAGDVVVLDWRAANRDPEVFGDPGTFDPAGHAADNLVYGTGPHVCPGRLLATRELRVLVRALLRAGRVALAGPAVREEAPAAGFREVPVRVG